MCWRVSEREWEKRGGEESRRGERAEPQEDQEGADRLGGTKRGRERAGRERGKRRRDVRQNSKLERD